MTGQAFCFFYSQKEPLRRSRRDALQHAVRQVRCVNPDRFGHSPAGTSAGQVEESFDAQDRLAGAGKLKRSAGRAARRDQFGGMDSEDGAVCPGGRDRAIRKPLRESPDDRRLADTCGTYQNRTVFSCDGRVYGAHAQLRARAR